MPSAVPTAAASPHPGLFHQIATLRGITATTDLPDAYPTQLIASAVGMKVAVTQIVTAAS